MILPVVCCTVVVVVVVVEVGRVGVVLFERAAVELSSPTVKTLPTVKLSEYVVRIEVI